MTNYIVNFTNINLTPITIEEGGIDTSSVDVTLFGRIRLEYGELLNENLLHLLENFSCPEDSLNPGTPDLTKTHNDLLSAPREGQFWHNKTTGSIYFFDGDFWIPILSIDDIAANWGSIGHGQQLPRPISQVTGYEFPYEECIWSVSPGGYDGEFQAVRCTTNADALVTMEYQLIGSSEAIGGYVNYLIIGIKGNNNLGSLQPVPTMNVTPTPTPTVGTSITVTPSGTPIPPTPSATSVTPTPTPTVSPSTSLSPLGVSTRLYMSPAVCDPGTPGPGGTLTDIYDTCGLVSKNNFDQSMYVSIQQLSGGVPPYTVNFSNLNSEVLFFGNELVQEDLNDPLQPTIPYQYNDNSGNSYVLQRYSGGNGITTNPIRSGLVAGEISYARFRYVSGRFYNKFDWQAGMRVWGFVVITDSIGNTKTLWVPSTEIDCLAGGTNIVIDPGATLYWTKTWGHYGIGGNNGCDNCVNCVV